MMLFEPKITKREHDEIVAAKDAEIDAWIARYDDAEARLAKFTAPRARDGAGRFLPLPAGDMGEVAR
jgi:hypothetical protein